MKYGLYPKAMWLVYKKSYKKELTIFKVVDKSSLMKKAKKEYKEIIKSIPEFDKNDLYVINIINCALFSSILLSLDKKPLKDETDLYYKNAMNNAWITKKAVVSERNYTEKGRKRLKKAAEFSKINKNEYSWIFDFKEGESLNNYSAYFHTCGILKLMTELGLREYVSSMCKYDYEMARLNNTEFKRDFTLESGGPYCDCNYFHRPKKG